MLGDELIRLAILDGAEFRLEAFGLRRLCLDVAQAVLKRAFIELVDVGFRDAEMCGEQCFVHGVGGCGVDAIIGITIGQRLLQPAEARAVGQGEAHKVSHAKALAAERLNGVSAKLRRDEALHSTLDIVEPLRAPAWIAIEAVCAILQRGLVERLPAVGIRGLFGIMAEVLIVDEHLAAAIQQLVHDLIERGVIHDLDDALAFLGAVIQHIGCLTFGDEHHEPIFRQCELAALGGGAVGERLEGRGLRHGVIDAHASGL